MMTFFLCLLSTVALAQSPAAVDALWAVDADGEMIAVDATGEALRIRGEDEEPLAVGDGVSSGDLVRTRNARVRLRMDGDQQIVIGEDSALLFETDRTVYQQAGDIFYRVRGYFKVSYESVEAAVEGTEFIVRIAEDGTVTVEVLQGTVRVSEERGEVVVERGEQSDVSPEQAPLPPVPIPRDTGASSASPLRTNLGAPRIGVAALAGVASNEDGGGFLPDAAGAGATIRLVGRYRLTPGWRATVDTGMVTRGGLFFLPQALGVERRLPLGLSVGGSAVALVGGIPCEAGTDVRIGGAATARLRLPVAYALSLEGLGRLGTTYSLRTDDTPELLYDLAVGVGIGF